MSIETLAPPVPLARARAALEATERVILSHSKTFYFATGLLPGHARQAIRVLYGFCRATDDLVDRGDATVEAVENWRAEVALEPAKQKEPILLSWALVRDQYQVNRRYEQELIDGVKMDLQKHRYQTWEELERYCYHVASTVGLLSMGVIGTAPGATFEQAEPYAIRLGVALQLTNVLRDVGEDAEKGRVYLPAEDLQRFGLTDADIINKVYDTRFIQLMHFEINRARELYRQSLPGIAYLSSAARFAVAAAALLYQGILDEIEKIDYRVHWLRAHTSGLRKVSMLPEILLTALSSRPAAQPE